MYPDPHLGKPRPEAEKLTLPALEAEAARVFQEMMAVSGISSIAEILRWTERMRVEAAVGDELSRQVLKTDKQ